ncbi:uncharacterized protein LOC143243835 [Tachypleus tridentatus]|uniref:uncharacterized protein LOC143243835 n=1 Tax=Tachypleus tridentatus TaxID=6853 RepID=UPI003FD3C351
MLNNRKMMYLCAQKCLVKLMKTWRDLCGRKLYISYLSMYGCPVVLNKLCYKETMLISKSAYHCTRQKLNNTSRNLDFLISSLHEKHKYKNIIGTKYKKKTEKLLKYPKKMIQPKGNISCDHNLPVLLMTDEAVSDLECYYSASEYPSKKTLKCLARTLAFKGNVEGVQNVQEIWERAYPNNYKWNIGFRHYLAEALWRNEQYEASVQLFESILLEYPHKKIKVSNMITLLTNHLIERNFEEQLDLLVQMVKRCADKDVNYVVGNVWKSLFLNDSVRYQQMGQSILDDCPKVKVCVCRHFENIISTAKELQCLDILQRLVEVCLQLEAQTYYSEVFSCLLEMQCAADDVLGAMETFRHVHRNGIILKGETCYKFVYFLGAQKLRVPQTLLQMKYGHPKTVPHQKIKFPF